MEQAGITLTDGAYVSDDGRALFAGRESNPPMAQRVKTEKNFLKRFVKGKTYEKKLPDGTIVQKKVGTNGNIAIAQVDIPGIEPILRAWSNEHLTPDGYLSITKSPNFKTYKIDFDGNFGTNKSWDRIIDTEARILIHVSERLKDNPNASGTIVLHTFYSPCESCRGIIKKFTEMHPNIKIIITWDKH